MNISKQLNLSTELSKLLTIILFFSIGTIQFLGFSTAYVFSTYHAVGTLLYLSFAFSYCCRYKTRRAAHTKAHDVFIVLPLPAGLKL